MGTKARQRYVNEGRREKNKERKAVKQRNKERKKALKLARAGKKFSERALHGMTI